MNIARDLTVAHHSRRRAEISRSSPTRSQSNVSARSASEIRSTPFALQRIAGGAAAEQQRREEQADLVDLAGVEERAGEMRAALEQHRGDAERAELVERRAHARRLVLAGRDEHLRAGGLQRVGVGARGRARDDHRQRDLGGRGDQLRARRQARERVEHDAARLVARARPACPSGRAVSCGSSASAVPMPDDDRVDRRAPAVRQLAAVLAADPLRVAGARGDLAVERHRRLEQHPRAPDARVLAKGLVEQPRARRELAVGDHDLDALVAQDPEAAARRPSRSGRRRRRPRA